MCAVHRSAHGSPIDGLWFVEIPEPPAPRDANQVLVGVEFSPVNPNDPMAALGIYACRPALPTVIGNDGKAKSDVAAAALPTAHPFTIRGVPRGEAARGSFPHSARRR
jgi:NADPH:quinone reductase-like Zn-dependent oxidoreductase